jgi:hypothetical protein
VDGWPILDRSWKTRFFPLGGSAKAVLGRLIDSDRVAQLVEQPPFKR